MSTRVPPPALGPLAATRSPANAVAPSLDAVRGAVARLGLRPYRLFLVWTYSTGDERGEAMERELRRVEVLPQPRITGLGGQSRSPTSGGILPEGSVQVAHVSLVQFDFDTLVGLVYPEPYRRSGKERALPKPLDFYYELYEDGRVAPPVSCRWSGPFEPNVPGRTKWRLATQPERHPFEWSFTLERISEDAARDGRSQQDSHDIGAPLPED